MKLTPFFTVSLVAAVMAGPIAAFADDNQPAQQPPPAAAATNQDPMAGTAPTSAVKPEETSYNQQQLDQMLAPIALYPDQLLMAILMASTYPLQVVDASHWLQDPKNASLKEDGLLDALKNLSWDPSVKSLVAYPQLVELLNKNLNWTQGLGTAYANQESDVLAQVQYLRQQASNAGNLQSNDNIVVQNDGPNITVAPANPDVVYVPYYNPLVVYGAWPWPDYRPVWFSDVYCGCSPVFVRGWAWGPRWGIYQPLWGWYGVRWGYGGGVFVHGDRLGRFHAGVFRGGLWNHPGGRGGHVGGGVHIGVGLHVGGGGGGGGHPAGHAASHGASHSAGHSSGGGHSSGHHH